MAYRAAVVGGSGYTGAELLRLLAGHPEIEVVLVTADSNAGATVARALPVAGRGLPGPRPTRRVAPADLAGLDVVFLALPARAVAGDRAPTSSTPSATSSTSAPTSGCRVARLRAVVRRDARARPSCSTGSRSACPSSTATRSSPRATSPRPAATRPPRRSRWRRCSPTGSSSRPASWSTRSSGVSGAGRGLKATSLFAEVERERHRLRPAHAPSHRARWSWRSRTSPGEPVQVLFTPHLVPDDAGHPRHLLRAAGRRTALEHRRAARRLPRLLRRRAVRASSPTARRRPRRRSARTPRTSPSATTRAPTPCSPSARSTTS